MNKTWVKLYRKLIDKGWFKRDHNCLIVFIWLLVVVDYKTGKYTLGRYYCEEVGMPASTFWKTLKRLEKLGAVNIKSNNRFSEVEIVKWANYQNPDDKGDSTGNNKGTSGEHLGNTNQEYKNKEIRKRAIGNPILEDPLFKRYLEVKDSGDDKAVRFKMSALPALDKRYPKWKFQNEWNEVASIIKQTN